MPAIESRSGAGQDFEFEFGEYRASENTFLLVKPSTTYKVTNFYPELAGSETRLRWKAHKGETRLVIEITGMPTMAFDDAPEPLKKALLPAVEKFATQLRKGRYNE